MPNELIALPSGATIEEYRGQYLIHAPGGNAIELKRNVHFGKPNKRLKQPILLKGGAEHIRIQYGVFDRYELMNAIEDPESGFFFYRFKCSLVKLNPADGKEYVVTEGYGSANSREASGGNASGFDLANQRLKIAEKRAMVDAVIKMAGLSTVFTQDIENDDFMEKSEVLTTSSPDSPITAAQRKRIFAIAQSVGLSTEQTRTWLTARGYAKTSAITQGVYDQLCSELEASAQ